MTGRGLRCAQYTRRGRLGEGKSLDGRGGDVRKFATPSGATSRLADTTRATVLYLHRLTDDCCTPGRRRHVGPIAPLRRGIIIDGKIHVRVVSIGDSKVRLGVTAPDSMRVDREEIHRRRLEQAAEQELALSQS